MAGFLFANRVFSTTFATEMQLYLKENHSKISVATVSYMLTSIRDSGNVWIHYVICNN